MAEVGSAYVTLVPSARGFSSKMKADLSDLSIGVRVDADLKGFRQSVDAGAAGMSTKVKVDADTAAARARIADVGNGKATINVDADTGGALATLASFSAEAHALVRDAHMNVDVDTGAAIAKLASFAAFANSISIGALGTGAAIQGLAGLTAAIAPAVGALALIPAAVGAAGLAFGTIKTGFSGFGAALKAMGAQASSSAATTDQSASQISSAQTRVADAYRNLDSVRANVDEASQRSARAVASARTALAQAQETAAERVADAERSAAQQVASAQQSAGRAIASAMKQQESAYKTLRSATTDLGREQKALTQAWQEGREALQDLQDQVDSNALDQRQAAFDLADAKKDLDEAIASGDPDKIARAQLAYDKQVETIDQLNKQTQRLTAENSKAQAAGVAGSKAVVEAQQRVSDASIRVSDATRAAGEADAAVNQARIEGAASVAKAQADGQRSIAKAQEEGSRQIASAQSALAEAQFSQQAQQRQGAEQIATAQRGIVSAQQALADALGKVGAKSTEVDKAAQALAKLSPNARAAALAIMGLKPAWDALKLDVQDAMFSGLASRISGLGTQYIPILRGAMVGMATDMNGAIRSVMDTLAMPANATGIQAALGNIRTGIGNILSPTGAVTQAFINMFNVGSTFFPQLGMAIGNAGQRFANFINAASASGQLQIWIQNALNVFSQLWQLIKNVGSILMSVMQAAASTGGNFLSVLVAVTGQWATFLNSAQGASLLQGIFSNIAAGVRAAMPLISALGSTLLQVVLPALAAALPAIGQAFGSLAPAVAPLGQAIAALAPVLAAVMVALAPVVSALVNALAPVISALAPLVSLLAGVLGAMLVSAINALAQPLLIVAQILVSTMTPILPVIAQLFGQLAGLIGGVLVQVLSAVAPLFPVLANALVNVLNAVMPLIPLWAQFIQQEMAAVLPILPVVVNLIVNLINALVPLIPPLINLATALMPAFVAILNIVIPIIAFLANVIGTVLVFAVNILVSVLGFLINLVATVLTGVFSAIGFTVSLLGTIFSAVGAAIALAWNLVVAAISWAWTNILSPVFTAIWTGLQFLGAIIFAVLVTPFVAAWNIISTLVSMVWTSVLSPIWYGAIVPALQFLGAMFTWLWQNIVVPVWNGIVGAISIAWAIVSSIWNAIIGFIVGIFTATWNFLYYGVILPIWVAIQNAISFAWNGVILPIWNAILAYIYGPLAAVMNWLYTNVVKPVWDALGAAIMFVWTNVIKPAFDAVWGGLQWLGARFQDAVNTIGRIWNGIRSLLAKPINFMIDVVWNKGIVPAWNKVAGLVGLGPIAPLGLIPEFATGGSISGAGTGTSDSILARVSNGEFIVRAAVARRTKDFLAALNAGDGEALQAAGGTRAGSSRQFRGRSGLGMSPMTPGFYSTGGLIDERVRQAKSWLSGPARGIPYVWGGGSQSGMDCSGMQAAVTHILSGRSPLSGRIGTTGSMPWGGFVPGINGTYAVGNKPNDHMAGTLAGQNVEQHGPSGTPFSFPSRWGADNGYFPQKFHLGEVGGQFVSGGSGGGFFDFISPLIRAAFDTLTNPAINLVRSLTGEPPPEWRRVPPALATKSRDTLREFMLSKVAAFLGQGVGGPPITDVGGLNGRQRQAAGTIIGVAKSRRMPRKAAEIGVATAMQESQLGTIGYGRAVDHDSLGLFQQRPSQGWGTPAQIQNDVYASNKFFDALSRINYLGLPHTVAAQMVQHSAFGNAYAKWVPLAISAVNAFPGGYDSGGIANGTGVMMKNTISPERVLSPRQTQTFESLVPLLDSMQRRATSSAFSADGDPGWQFPTEFRLSSDSTLQLDGDGLIRIVDGRLEAVAESVNDGRRF